ncbi:hypothetical protein PV341_17735 [Streptomyces sp. PA03-1a]|nr:hypothetical protein [Streptomyces sp. PA03-1a]MDX2811690.1 hypothetical protein [Streptomyces sp. PA03-5A]
MGTLFGYYTAADDQDAGRAVVRVDGEPSGSGYDGLVVKGIDPTTDLLTVEFVITGRPAGVIKSDSRHGHVVATVGGGEVVSVSLTDAFRDALATIDQAFLGDVAYGWSRSARFTTPPDTEHLVDFLQQLAALAKRAVAQGHGLYCWIRQ